MSSRKRRSIKNLFRVSHIAFGDCEQQTQTLQNKVSKCSTQVNIYNDFTYHPLPSGWRVILQIPVEEPDLLHQPARITQATFEST
jgi:hypothetical protein